MRTLTRAIRVSVVSTSILTLGGVALAGGADPITLTDRTVESGLLTDHGPDEVGIPGFQEWMTGGCAVGDFNNDGWPDLFWIGGGLTPDRLFINRGDGTFADEAAAWGVAQLHCGCGASVADYDNDGDDDIFVTSFGDAGQLPEVGRHRLYRNDGPDVGFTEVAADAGVNVSSAVASTGFGSGWGDFDLDGDLDLAVMSWWAQGNGNRLFRNNGDGTFTDVTDAMTGDSLDDVWGFQPAFADMNGDRWPELLVSADFESSRYLANLFGAAFQNLTVPSGTGLDDNGMGQTVGDFNNDGLLDWYVTSIHQDVPEKGDNVGNMLYMQVADHVYSEESVLRGVNDGGWGWGTVAVDFNHDGWLDIFAVNGRVSSKWGDELPKLFRNDGDAMFTDVALESGVTDFNDQTSTVSFDYDRDGDRDLVVFNNNDSLTLYRNDSASKSWLTVRLDGSTNPLIPARGFNSRIEVDADGTTFVRYLNSSPSYLGTSEAAVHFGLDNARSIDAVRIIWSRGYVTELEDVAVNQDLEIAAPTLYDFSADGTVGMADLQILIAAWGEVEDAGQLVADANNDGKVDAFDLAAMLAAWSR